MESPRAQREKEGLHSGTSCLEDAQTWGRACSPENLSNQPDALIEQFARGITWRRRRKADLMKNDNASRPEEARELPEGSRLVRLINQYVAAHYSAELSGSRKLIQVRGLQRDQEEQPRFTARWRALAGAAASRSKPRTLPPGPTMPAARRATSPTPEPSSRTRIPGETPT
jgi:hypothetical protein